MNILYRIYHYCIAAPIILVLTIITCLFTIVGCLFNSNYWGYYPAKWWARAMCFFFGVKVKVETSGRLRHLLHLRLSGPQLQVDDAQGIAQLPARGMGVPHGRTHHGRQPLGTRHRQDNERRQETTVKGNVDCCFP